MTPNSIKPIKRKHVLMTSILPIILILAGVVLFMMTYWPSGITVDQNNNIKLGVVIGKGHKIPANEITVSEVPEGLLSHLIRTNGMSLGKINYGKFYSFMLGQIRGLAKVSIRWRPFPCRFALWYSESAQYVVVKVS